jgi:hypothetical protein
LHESLLAKDVSKTILPEVYLMRSNDEKKPGKRSLARLFLLPSAKTSE